MGHGKSLLRDQVDRIKDVLSDDRDCWSALMLPKRAPEWYRRMVAGLNEEDVHQQEAPKGSMFLLGHVRLSVPDVDSTQMFFGRGLGMKECEQDGELHFNAGATQIQAPVRPGEEPQVWPGELRFWVEDMRETADMLNIMNHQLNQLLLDEMLESESGGEYAIRLKDPSRTNFFLVSEAPEGFAAQIRAIPSNRCVPGAASNILGLSDATVKLKNRAQLAGAADFYEKLLGAAVTRTHTVYERRAMVDSFTVHFSPGQGLHQTLTFKVDPTQQLSNLGSVCFYVQDKHGFRLAFAKAKAAGLLKIPQAWQEVEKASEFTLPAVVSPSAMELIMPMEHVIRYTDHPECPLQPVWARVDLAMRAATSHPKLAAAGA